MTEPRKVRYACVCASNVNRSMAAHEVLQKHKYDVSSYGTNSQISMPSPTGVPNIYDFGTTYQEILDDMLKQDNPYYREHGLIEMIDRDRHIKSRPERFASTFDRSDTMFDVIFTYQEKIMERVISEFHTNGNAKFELCTVVNIETIDDHTHALESAKITLQLAEIISKLPTIPEKIEDTLNAFVDSSNAAITFHIVSY